MTSNYFFSDSQMEAIYKEFDISDYQKKSLEELKAEKFENISRVMDWRNYISGIGDPRWNAKGIAAWRKLSDMERFLKYVKAVTKAEAEDWD